MKNSINFFLATFLLMTLSISFPLNAKSIDTTVGLLIKVDPSKEGRAFGLRIANLQKQPTDIKIIDVWGYTLLSLKVRGKDGYCKMINLNNLPIGDYLLQVGHPSGKYNQAFHLEGEAVSFFHPIGKNEGFVFFTTEKQKAPDLKCHITAENNKLNMQLEGLKEGLARIHLCDMLGKVYFNKKIKTGNALDEQFALDKLRPGEHILVIQMEEKTIIQPFEKTNKGLLLKNTLVSKPTPVDEMEIYTQR